jgi:tRNA/tmRNA/rRNA uracil-C5-methylase (TrmA/RlmC/RlmD family)
VTLVEGDPISGMSLDANAEPFGARVRVEHRSVESYLRSYGGSGSADPATTFLVDPPRTGMSRDAVGGLIDAQSARLVYVSCDVATLARDARILIDAGYELESLVGVDLFPNTAHVETVAAFNKPKGNP